MQRSFAENLKRHRWYLGALIAPLGVWLALKAVPGLDIQVGAPSLHVVVMTIVAGCSIVVAVLAGHASTRLRQPALVLLACGCLSVGLLLLGDSHTLVVKVPGSTNAGKGQRVPVRIAPEMCHLFREDGMAFAPLEQIADTTKNNIELMGMRSS